MNSFTFLFFLITAHILTLLIPTTDSNNISTIAKPKPFVLSLIHGNLILSKNDLKLLETKGFYDDDFPIELHGTNPGLLFVNLTIGSPPVPQLLVMDTGSHRLWVLCNPCRGCQEVTSPIFDPSRSSTYRELGCDDERCQNAFGPECKVPAPCTFRQIYVRGFYSSGVVATEKVTLGTWQNEEKSVGDMLIGCASNSNHESFNDARFNGVLGLAFYGQSFLNNLGSKFSYCIGNLTNPNYRHSQLRLGSDIDLEGDPIPMDVYGFYSIFLHSITAGDDILDIPPHMAIINTGTLRTDLGNAYFTTLQQKFRTILKGLGLVEIEMHNDMKRLCFRGRTGNMEKDLEGFPLVRFQFAYGDAALELNTSSLFTRGEWQRSYCLAITRSMSREVTTIGLLALQNYNMGFDINERKMYVQKVDCETYNSDF